MMQWLKNLSDGVKALIFLGGILLAGITGALVLKNYLDDFRTLPGRVTKLEADVAVLTQIVSTLDNQAVRYGNGVGLKVSFDSTVFQLDACMSCSDGQRSANFVKDSKTSHQVYLTKEP